MDFASSDDQVRPVTGEKKIFDWVIIGLFDQALPQATMSPVKKST